MYEAGDEVFRKKFVDLQRMGQRLREIDRHDALFLLRHCFAIPKVTYFLRTAPWLPSYHDNKSRLKNKKDNWMKRKTMDTG